MPSIEKVLSIYYIVEYKPPSSRVSPMNFFISYADALAKELNEDGSNIGDIVVDWESLIKKVSTVTTNDTVTPDQHTSRPSQDGIMPGHKFKPRSVNNPVFKLSEIWPRKKESNLTHSVPMHLEGSLKSTTIIIVRRKTSGGIRKKKLNTCENGEN